MASQESHNLSSKAGEALGHAQVKKDEYVNEAADTINRSSDSHKAADTYVSQAGQLLQQTGEQVKTMAQGAADAVKNTLGISPENDNTDNNPNTTSRLIHPSNPRGAGKRLN